MKTSILLTLFLTSLTSTAAIATLEPRGLSSSKRRKADPAVSGRSPDEQTRVEELQDLFAEWQTSRLGWTRYLENCEDGDISEEEKTLVKSYINEFRNLQVRISRILLYPDSIETTNL